jgi:hypothetical protein
MTGTTAPQTHGADDYAVRFAAVQAEIEAAIADGQAQRALGHRRRLSIVASAAAAAGQDTSGAEWTVPTHEQVQDRARIVVGGLLEGVDLPEPPVQLLDRLPAPQRQQVEDFKAAWPGLPLEKRPGAFIKWAAVLRNWGQMHLPRGARGPRRQLNQALDRALQLTGQAPARIELTPQERREEFEHTLRVIAEVLGGLARFF